MPRLIPTIIGLFATLLSAVWLTGQQSPPDLILVNGKIFTSSSTHPYVEALAIRGERISSVGTSREISGLSSTQTKHIDLGGRVVIPGINDAHYHCGVEPNAFHLQFNSEDPTWREVADQLAAAETKAPTGALILGDIGPTALDDSQATGASLDKLSPGHPVLLRTWSGHAFIVNRLGLAKLGVKEDEPDPVGGRFLRSTDNGKLTGVAYEYAVGPFLKALEALTSEAEVWLANCYGRADFAGNHAAQLNWLSLSERIRWQSNDRIRETLYNQHRKYRMISFQVFLEVDLMPQRARALERVRQPLGSGTRIGSGAAIETNGDLRLVVTPA
jgi:hypothetical protein